VLFITQNQSQENICLAAILILENSRVLFTTDKRHPVRNSQVMEAVRDAHSFFPKESLKIKKNNQQFFPSTAVMECVCACLKVSTYITLKEFEPCNSPGKKRFCFQQILL
jgi:pyrimidine deaminase RibD-like protein